MHLFILSALTFAFFLHYSSNFLFFLVSEIIILSIIIIWNLFLLIKCNLMLLTYYEATGSRGSRQVCKIDYFAQN